MNQIMIFNTTKCQEIFRNRFTGPSGTPFLDFKSGRSINDTPVDASDLLLYKHAKYEDILSYYYKSLLSFCEGLDAVSRKNYTWATVKLYYSVFYGLRCSLLCRDVVMVRAGGNLYRFKIASGVKYAKPKEMNDHSGTIYTYVDFFQRTDFFCSNPIEDRNAYFWLKECRDIVNYKDGVFHDPETTSMWENIDENIKSIGIKKSFLALLMKRTSFVFCPNMQF